MNVLEKFEAKQLEKYQAQKDVPAFAPGDTVKVNVRIKEGTRERIQAYEGVCIARAGNGVSATFTVRKISLGEGVERVFPLWSSRIDSIEVVRRGSVRRAKLYYLRERRGKSARIAERTTGFGIEAVVQDDNEMSKTAQNKAKKAEKAARRAENKKIEEEAKAARQKEKDDAKAAAAAEKAAAEAPEENAEGESQE